MKTFINPVHIDPAKPMNPSHLRHILYTDFLYKSLSGNGQDVEYVYNRLQFDVAAQVVKLSAYINGKTPSLPLSDAESVGNAYVQLHEENFTVPENIVDTMRKKLETELCGHEYYQYILPEWQAEHRVLGVMDPGYATPQRFGLSFNECLEILKETGAVLDARNIDGNVYLDSSDKGRRLRKITGSTEFSYNYIFNILRSLLEKVESGDTVYLLFDPETREDFTLIADVLNKIGCDVISRPTARFSLGGKTISARKGGWMGFTVKDLLQRYEREYPSEVIGLGFRMYFLTAEGSGKEFSFFELDRAVRVAAGYEEKYGTADFDQLNEIVVKKNEKPVKCMQEWLKKLTSEPATYFMNVAYEPT